MAAEELTLCPPHLPCDGVGEGKMHSLLCPLLSVQVRDLATKVRELTLPHTSCGTRENRPCCALELTLLLGEHMSQT